MDHSVAAVDVVWGVEIATFSMNWRGPNLMVVGNNIEQAFKQFWEGIDIVIEKLSEYPQIWDKNQNHGFWNVSRFKYGYFGCPCWFLVGFCRLPSERSFLFWICLTRFEKNIKCCQWEVFYFPMVQLIQKCNTNTIKLIFSSTNICVFFVSPLSTSGCVFAPHSTSSDSFFGNQSTDPERYTPRLDNLPSNVASCTWQGTGLWMAFVYESLCFRNPMRDSHGAILVYLPRFEPWISTK